MSIIAVAKDQFLLLDLSEVLQKAFPQDHIELFVDPMLAVKYVYNNPVDTAFVSTELYVVDCFKFEATLKKTKSNVKVIFVVNNEEDAADMEIFDGLCIFKPVTKAAVKEIVST